MGLISCQTSIVIEYTVVADIQIEI